MECYSQIPNWVVSWNTTLRWGNHLCSIRIITRGCAARDNPNTTFVITSTTCGISWYYPIWYMGITFHNLKFWKTNVFKKKNISSLRMEYCITVNPIPHSQYRTKFDYEWSIEYQLIRNPLVSVNIRSANLLIFKILYYGMVYTRQYD